MATLYVKKDNPPSATALGIATTVSSVKVHSIEQGYPPWLKGVPCLVNNGQTHYGTAAITALNNMASQEEGTCMLSGKGCSLDFKDTRTISENSNLSDLMEQFNQARKQQDDQRPTTQPTMTTADLAIREEANPRRRRAN